MKVKEVAEFLKISTDELLKLLKNVSVGKTYTEDSDLDKDLEKKLAKRYGVPYPFKSKPKVAPSKPVPAGVKVAPNKPQEPAKEKPAAPKPAAKPESNNKPAAVKAKPENKQPVNNQPAKPKPANNQPAKGKPSNSQPVKPKPAAKARCLPSKPARKASSTSRVGCDLQRASPPPPAKRTGLVLQGSGWCSYSRYHRRFGLSLRYRALQDPRPKVPVISAKTEYRLSPAGGPLWH